MKQLFKLKVFILFFVFVFNNINCADGDLDLTFDSDGKVIVDVASVREAANGIAIQSDGKIILVGEVENGFRDEDIALIRLNLDGSLDLTFGVGGKVITPITDSGIAYDVAIQDDGKIVVCGSSADDLVVVRYNTNGSLDGTFGAGGIATINIGIDGDVGRSLVIQQDGKIVVGGYTNESTGNFLLARFLTNGSLDPAFGVGGTLIVSISSDEDLAYSVALQADGKIVLVGFTSNSGSSNVAVVRYGTNGLLDATFGTGGIVTTDLGDASDIGYGVAVQQDGKIVVAGRNGMGNSSGNFVIIRYNTDGSLDTSFGGTGIVETPFFDLSIALDVVIQNDGKIIAGGTTIDSMGPNSFFALARYNIDGSLDTSFGSGGKVTTEFFSPGLASINALALQQDGKIIAGGSAFPNLDTDASDFAAARYQNTLVESANGVNWSDLHVCLNCNVSVKDVCITFSGESSINGRGFCLSLEEGAAIKVASESSLLLKNITVKNVKQSNIRCLTNSGTILLQDVTYLLDDDYTFSMGNFVVDKDFVIDGYGNNFSYKSSQISVVNPCSSMVINPGVTFDYDPAIAQSDLIRLADTTSKLMLNSATLSSSSTGLQLVRGKLVVRGKSFVESDASVLSEAIMFGDGVDSGNNLKVTIAPAATLEVKSGFLVNGDV